MKTLTQQKTAIEFLKSEKKYIDIDVMDFLSESDFFIYNGNNAGSESLTVKERDFDWNDFYFQLSVKVDFDFSAWFFAQTFESPEEKDLNFKNIQSEIEILECTRWNDELDDMEEYRLSASERKEIINYFKRNIILNS